MKFTLAMALAFSLALTACNSLRQSDPQATSAGSSSDTDTTRPPTPMALVLAGGAHFLNPGECYSNNVSTVDNHYDAAIVSEDVVINLTSTGVGSFYANQSDCNQDTNAVTSVTVLSGNYNAGFYFKSSAIGAQIVSVSADNFTVSSLSQWSVEISED